MIQQLLARGLAPSEILEIQVTHAKDKNNFARGFLGYIKYRELKLKDFDLNQIPKAPQNETL